MNLTGNGLLEYLLALIFYHCHLTKVNYLVKGA
nr:MAG TPA: hypothetical protein [Caudoviricetes sp.]